MAADREIALTALLDRLPEAGVTGNRAQPVTAIEIDSRSASPGALFVELRGIHTDGHLYVAQAIARGASAVVVEEHARVEESNHVAIIRVGGFEAGALRSLRSILWRPLAMPRRDRRYRNERRNDSGANGYADADTAAIPCGVVGTIGAQLGSRCWQLGNTTPLPPTARRAGRHAGRWRASGRHEGGCPRTRARARRGRWFPGRRPDQRHAQSSRLSRIAGRLRRSEASSFSN